jgi:hypothetical protein
LVYIRVYTLGVPSNIHLSASHIHKQNIVVRKYLENEEPVIVEVDAFLLELVGDLGEVACAVVDQILGRVVAVGDAGHSDLAARDRLEVLAIL